MPSIMPGLYTWYDPRMYCGGGGRKNLTADLLLKIGDSSTQRMIPLTDRFLFFSRNVLKRTANDFPSELGGLGRQKQRFHRAAVSPTTCSCMTVTSLSKNGRNTRRGPAATTCVSSHASACDTLVKCYEYQLISSRSTVFFPSLSLSLISSQWGVVMQVR